ncbi:hypothetical protein HanRHA438_Chr04g0200411 [Helianthus annuus]|nr:hypothetical protein HanRHA438_Chr04g0200411 [Helianthus annuus]
MEAWGEAGQTKQERRKGVTWIQGNSHLKMTRVEQITNMIEERSEV